MEKINLKVQIRETFKKATKNLRKNGLVPAVLYGQEKANKSLTVSRHDLEKILREVGTTSILVLDIEGDGSKNALIHSIDFHPVTGLVQHLDFYEVSMTEKITTTVPLSFVGDSTAVIELGGTLVTNKDEVEIECLPGDLPHSIEVDVTSLSDFEATIHLRDLKAPSGVEIQGEPEELVATVEPPRSEEEMAELEEPVEAPEMPESETGNEEPAAEEKTE